jgi:hypothetical protein
MATKKRKSAKNPKTAGATPRAIEPAGAASADACANFAGLRRNLAAEKGKAGAAERGKVIRALESLEAGHRELHLEE